MAISKVKTKLDELTNGVKVPSSIKLLEKDLKAAEQSVSDLEKKYQQVIDNISKNQIDLDFAKGIGNADKVISIQTDTKNLDIQSTEIATQLENARDKANKLKVTLEQTKLNPKNTTEGQLLIQQLNVMNSKLSQTKEEANATKNAIKESFQKKHLLNFGNGIDSIGNKIDSFKSRITKLLVTSFIFNSIGSGLSSLKNDFISLLKTNNDFSTSLNQIKANLMTAFTPIYNACLPAINTLMNALTKLTGTIALFVSGLFGTSLEDAKKQAQGLSNALKDTKKNGKAASGSLASFDNLEVISDNSISSGNGTNNDTGIDYSGEIQYSQGLLDILNKIKDFISQNSEYILAFFAGIVGGLLAIKLGADAIMGLGIGVAIAGIILTIESIIAYLKDPTWENFGSILQGISLFIMGVAIAFGVWPVAIAAAVGLVIATIIKYWDKIKVFLQSGIDWLKTKGREIFTWIFGDVFTPIYDAFVNILQSIFNYFDSTFTNIKTIFDNIISFIKNVFTGNWKGAWENVKNIFFSILDLIKNHFLTIFSILGNLVIGVGKTFGNIIAGAFKAVVNGVLGAMESILNFPLKSINKLIKTINKVPGINLGTLPTFNLPRLATGTVIPPRHEFAAILGDQKHGTNIEAPLETIKQANREVMQEFIGVLSGLNNNEREIVFRNLTIVAQFGNKDFSKIVVEAVRMAEKEMGKQLFVSV